MSFAVDNIGRIYAWGLNKNNCLLINQPEKGLVKTIVDEPLPVVLPDYFLTSNAVNVVQNTQKGFDFYTSSKPVQSESSRNQAELERLREENTKLRKKVKDYQSKFQKINSGALSGFGGGDKGNVNAQ